MSWKCCDQEISTPFCPLCGRSKDNGPLMELFHYARGMEKRANSWLNNARKRKFGQYHIERSEMNHKRWKRMTEALIELMNKAEGKDAP